MQTGAPAPLISKEVNEIIQANAEVLDKAICYDRDFEYVLDHLVCSI